MFYRIHNVKDAYRVCKCKGRIVTSTKLLNDRYGDYLLINGLMDLVLKK